MASLQMTRPSMPEPQRAADSPNVANTSNIPMKNGEIEEMLAHKRPKEEQESEGNWVLKKVKAESAHNAMFEYPMTPMQTDVNTQFKIKSERNSYYGSDESRFTLQLRPLEEDHNHIEQMIEELLHYGSIELCSYPTQAL